MVLIRALAPARAVTVFGCIFLLHLEAPDRTQLQLQFGLFPFHSPLLGKSQLVSPPALNDMLKFRA